MGTWMRANGKIDLDLTNMYQLNKLSTYRYEHYVKAQAMIRKWIERQVNNLFDLTYTLDQHCTIMFDESTCHHSPYETLKDFDEQMIDVSRYDSVTIYINLWNRHCVYDSGCDLIEKIFHTLRSNGCWIQDTTLVTVTADNVREMTLFGSEKKMTIDRTPLDYYF